MLIHPDLQALRDDDAPQRQAQTAIRAVHEAWRTAGEGDRLERELAAFGAGQHPAELPLLGSLFDPGEPQAAQGFVNRTLAPILALLGAEPLSQAPWRFAMDDAVTSLVLARHDTTALTVQLIDDAALARKPAAKTVSFLPAETWERVLCGNGAALRIRALCHLPDRARLECTPVSMRMGEVYSRLGTDLAQVLCGFPDALVLLKLQRRLGGGGVVREYRLEDGQLVHQSAGTPRDSRLELAAALLGRMERCDAAPVLAAMAEEQGAQSLRWQALRQCLALDTATGFAALCRIAARAGDPLAGPAGALRAQLLETSPQLAGACSCPA